MLSRCSLAHYLTITPRSLQSIHVSSSRAFHSSRPNLNDSTNTQRFIPRERSIFSDASHLANDVPQRRQPRQAMTARESNAFNEMFAMIFDAAADQEKSSSSSDSVIGVGTEGIDDLIGKLRKYPKRLKWSTEVDDVLDRQKEVINLFSTDQELLEWATDAVFGESQRYEAAARKAISEAAASGVKGELPMLQPPTYPYLVALIMRTFREKFNDPHLALSMFEYARNLSTASYVFGCSSQAYHQLIETRWRCFQDLTGVLEALKEMQLNGVKVIYQTRRLVEKLRREIGEKHLWAEESEVGSSEVLNILAQIETLALSGQVAPHGIGKGSGASQDVKWDDWKTNDSQGENGDEWGFDQWSSRPAREFAREKGSREVQEPGGGKVWSNWRFKEDQGFDDWDFNEEKPVGLQDRHNRKTDLEVGRTPVTEGTALEQSDLMDDWGFEDGGFRSGASRSRTNSRGNKDEWKSSQNELQTGGVERQGRGDMGRGFSRTLRPRSSGLEDEWGRDDGEMSVGWLKPNVQGSQDGDGRGLDQDTLNEPKRRGRTLKRRRFDLKANVSQQSQDSGSIS